MDANKILSLDGTRPDLLPTCFAYDGDRVCGAPALFFDAQRGCMVCAKHKPAMKLAEQVLGVLPGPGNSPDRAVGQKDFGGSAVVEEPGAAVRAKAADVPPSTGVAGVGGPGSTEEDIIEFNQGDASLVIHASGPWRETEVGAAILRALGPLAKKLGVEL